MKNKDVQLFILRHLEAGHTKANEHILIDIPTEQRRNAFIDALSAIENQGFLCSNYNTSNEPELWNAYVSDTGRTFIRENTPEPLIHTVQRASLRWVEVAFVALITVLVTSLVSVLLTLYITGKIG